MATLPPIDTPNLRIVPFGPEHLTERYVGWLNDPEVVNYSEQRHRRHDSHACRAYLASFARSDDQFCAIIERPLGLGHIGNLTVTVDRPNLTADLAIMIGERRAWGRGYGQVAWRAVLEELLIGQELRKVTAGCMAENAAMIAVMERSGMTFECRRKAQFLLDGRSVDAVHYARFADTVETAK